MRTPLFVVLLTGCMGATGDGPDGGPTGGKGDGGGPRLALNDVSILFPLPASEAARADSLWLMPRAGEHGPYFPAHLVDQLPTLNGDVPDQLGYPSAMVTSLRFDPCFGPTCQPQLRLVAQPVLTGGTSVQMLEDAAAHLFYELDDDEAKQVARALLELKQRSPEPTTGVLRVHPGFASSEFVAGVRELVTTWCREDNLIRITTNAFAFDNWGFSKLDLVDGELVRQPLPAMQAPGETQAWLRGAFVDSLEDPSGRIDPAPVRGFEYFLAIENFAMGAPKDADAARAAAATLLRIENPKLTSTEDTDCVSCHLATQGRLWAERNGVPFDLPERFVAPDGYDTRLELAPAMRGNLGATISFGWHHHHDGTNTPSISQRTINESVEVAEYTSRHLLP